MKFEFQKETQVAARLLERDPGREVLSAVMDLLKCDRYLLEIDVNERSISHRLAMHLQAKYPNFHVDCEYNRDGVDPKRIQHLNLRPDDEDSEAKTVFPDIIVHTRNSTTNYLVIEIKKSSNTVDRSVDYAKLRGYKRDLGFQFALFLELSVGKTPDISIAEWIDD